jgi:hypothetical protein
MPSREEIKREAGQQAGREAYAWQETIWAKYFPGYEEEAADINRAEKKLKARIRKRNISNQELFMGFKILLQSKEWKAKLCGRIPSSKHEIGNLNDEPWKVVMTWPGNGNGDENP